MKRIKLNIYGRVQGVWYRKNTQEQALKIGLTGLVRNENDGSVYAEGQGSDEQLIKWIEWCKEGPEFAHVTDLQIQEMDVVSGEKGFEILR